MTRIAPAQRKYLALDIETAKILPEDAELRSHRPLGICCVAMMTADDDQPHLWYSVKEDRAPAAKMNSRDLSELLDFLCAQVSAGYTIVTWNGLGFDFDILAEESGRRDICRQLAVEHIDLMFHCSAKRASQ